MIFSLLDLTQRNLNLELLKITHQIQIGHDIELYCGTTDGKLGTPSQSPTSWHFKACGYGLNQSSCSKAIESRDSRSWQKLQCSTENNCGSSILIKNPTEKDSGLYRCSIYPFKPSLQIQVVKTYFLDVRSNFIYFTNWHQKFTKFSIFKTLPFHRQLLSMAQKIQPLQLTHR